eukprot:COSAG03_NODE_4521_length_1524_cov_1.273684_2_plen_274_part_01
MEASAAFALLSGGSIELDRLNDELCDELCAALRARAPSGGEGVMDLSKMDGGSKTDLLVSKMDFEGRNSTGETPFLLACTRGHVECMQLLVEAGCDTAAITAYGSNALMLAARSGVAAAVRTALAAGWCELEATSIYGRTAFLLACFKGCVECMQLLAEAGCNTAVISNDGSNALMSVADSGAASAVRMALAANWCELDAMSTHGRTAFLLACFKGCVECMHVLAEAGCDTAVISNSGMNALMWAACSGVAAAVRAALAAGWCELEATSSRGCT